MKDISSGCGGKQEPEVNQRENKWSERMFECKGAIHSGSKRVREASCMRLKLLKI